MREQLGIQGVTGGEISHGSEVQKNKHRKIKIK